MQKGTIKRIGRKGTIKRIMGKGTIKRIGRKGTTRRIMGKGTIKRIGGKGTIKIGIPSWGKGGIIEIVCPESDLMVEPTILL